MNSCMGRAGLVLWPTRGGPRPSRAGPHTHHLSPPDPALASCPEARLCPDCGEGRSRGRAAYSEGAPFIHTPHAVRCPQSIPAARLRPGVSLQATGLGARGLPRELTVQRADDRTGSRAANTRVAGSRRWGGRRRERRPGPPPSRTHDGRGDGTGGPGRHLCAGHAPHTSHAHWSGCRVPGGRGLRGGGHLAAAPGFRVSTRGLQPSLRVSFRLAAPGTSPAPPRIPLGPERLRRDPPSATCTAQPSALFQ